VKTHAALKGMSQDNAKMTLRTAGFGTAKERRLRGAEKKHPNSDDTEVQSENTQICVEVDSVEHMNVIPFFLC
jgi:hypothetical protein